MSLLVIAYPEIEKSDFDWIQKIRAKDDERYFNVVQPHFTLVFPVMDIAVNTFESHVKKVAKQFNEFYFVLRSAQIVKDSFSDYTDVFLVPEEGYRIFLRLHDLLYTGILENELRLDIPFIPHLGIANNLDPIKCRDLAEKLNSKGIEIVGKISTLSIVEYDFKSVRTIKEISL